MRNDVSLRDVQEDDLPIFFEHQADPQASQMAAFASRDRNSFMAHWAKILKDETLLKQTILYAGQVVGNVVCFEMLGKREVGYWIGREYWGKGIATRALSLFLQIVRLRPLYAYAAKHNIGSWRVLEKCGFQGIGEDSQPASPSRPPVEVLILMLPADEEGADC